MKYVCPMHPEVHSNKPGKCSKCGMDLVEKGLVEKTNYLPLAIILGLILLVSIIVSSVSGFAMGRFISYFMIGFFLVFSGFKLLDLKGFASGYQTYDLLAKRVPAYGYIYPFIELSFALTMILNFWPTGVLIAELFVMTFSGIGVAIKLLRKEKFECACLGTFLKVPLTKVTLIEDFGMAFLALILLFSRI